MVTKRSDTFEYGRYYAKEALGYPEVSEADFREFVASIAAAKVDLDVRDFALGAKSYWDERQAELAERARREVEAAKIVAEVFNGS